MSVNLNCASQQQATTHSCAKCEMWTVAVPFPRHVLSLCRIVGCNKQLLSLANTILQSRIFQVAKVACIIEEKPRRYYAALDMQMFVLTFCENLHQETTFSCISLEQSLSGALAKIDDHAVLSCSIKRAPFSRLTCGLNSHANLPDLSACPTWQTSQPANSTVDLPNLL